MLISYKELDYEQQFHNHFNKIMNHEVQETHSHITKVIVCFVNRSGSNFLCDQIEKATGYNLGGEYFNPEPVLNNSKDWNASSLDEYVNKLIESQSRNEGFVCKMGWHQILYLKKVGLYDKYFADAKVILLERKDILEQAVSYYKALQTNQWTSNQNADQKEVVFNGEKIRDLVVSISNHYSIFKAFIAVYDVDSMHLFYEDFCSDKQQFLKSVVDFIGTDFISFVEKSKIEKQYDEVNNRLIEEFKAFALEN
ncbi:MAG: Stf0 family sulfotransferase [Psychrobacter sp.]